MGKTSPYRGTTKKAIKQEEKARKYFAEESVKEHKEGKPAKGRARARMEDIAKGKTIGPTDLKALTKEFETAQKYARTQAKQQFGDIEKKAISDYQRYTQPSLAAQYSPDSSAAKQAIQESQIDLQRSLASDFSGLQQSIAGNYMNQLSNNRQFGTNAMLQSNAGLLGHPVQPIIGGHQTSYNQPQGGTSGMGGTIVGGLLGAGGAYAGSEAGAAAITSLFASSIQVKENIQDYDRGLETLPFLQVKNYDYKIEVPGRQHNRVGLIAEHLPEELTAEVGDILSADVYGLVGLLINCVKQLDEKVKILEAK